VSTFNNFWGQLEVITRLSW